MLSRLPRDGSVVTDPTAKAWRQPADGARPRLLMLSAGQLAIFLFCGGAPKACHAPCRTSTANSAGFNCFTAFQIAQQAQHQEDHTLAGASAHTAESSSQQQRPKARTRGACSGTPLPPGD